MKRLLMEQEVDYSKLALDGLVIPILGERTAAHERFLIDIRAHLARQGSPTSQAMQELPTVVLDSVFNSVSGYFPAWPGIAALLNSCGTPAKEMDLWRGRWRKIASTYTARESRTRPSHARAITEAEADPQNFGLRVAEASRHCPLCQDKTLPSPFISSKRQSPARQDAQGYEDLRPNPLEAKTVPDFLNMMRHFHIWTGERPLRELARESQGAFGASTLSETLNRTNTTRLPSLRVVTAFVQACGGNEDDLTRWTTAWRAIRLSQTNSASRPGKLRAIEAS